MKFGFRVPSLKKRIAARTSVKRYIRHSMGLKMPRGFGFLTNPKKALYNKIYRKTSFGIGDIVKHSSENKQSQTINNSGTLLESDSPTSKDNSFVFNPKSFTTIINTRDKVGADNLAVIIITLGIIISLFNSILGLMFIIGGAFWRYKVGKTSEFIIKNNLSKAKKMLKSNKFEEALLPLKIAVNLDNDNPELNYLLGTALHATGRYGESIEYLEKYAKSVSNDLDAKLILAYSFYKQKQYRNVLPLLQQFPQENANYLLILLLLGGSFLELKEYEMAIDVFKRGPLRKTNFDSYLVQLHYMLGIAYKENGDKQNAIRELKRVYAFDVNYRSVKKEIDELEPMREQKDTSKLTR